MRATAFTGAAAALFQAGLILKAKAVLQCPDDPARPALACSGQTVSKRFGPIQDSNNLRERKIFTKHRAIDRLSGRPYSRRRGKGGFKFLSPGCCAKFKHSGGPSLALHFTGDA